MPTLSNILSLTVVAGAMLFFILEKLRFVLVTFPAYIKVEKISSRFVKFTLYNYRAIEKDK
jgi:hypothetical protein